MPTLRWPLACLVLAAPLAATPDQLSLNSGDGGAWLVRTQAEVAADEPRLPQAAHTKLVLTPFNAHR